MLPELLAPAGNLEKLIWAEKYGADAVYFGMKNFSLRNFAGNFSLDDASQGISYLHKKGKKAYITLNIYPHSEEFSEIINLAHKLDEMKADAFIISDLGLICELVKKKIKAKIHISTQANTLNYHTALVYKKLGASRVNLARELSLENIKFIQKNLKDSNIETEVFIHGAVCFSYSGRCAISDYLTGFSANRGECKHPCRWKYHLVEELRPNEYIPVFEDNRGLYLFNPKEIALFPYVKDIINTGVKSLKIEGRMKSIHYIASIVSLYRRILNNENISIDQGFSLLARVQNRGYSYGFINGKISNVDYNHDKKKITSNAVFIGNIIEEKNSNYSIFEVRNKTFAGEKVEILEPSGNIFQDILPNPLFTQDGQYLDYANHGQYLLLNKKYMPYSIFRRYF